jgi:hypothetical protein
MWQATSSRSPNRIRSSEFPLVSERNPVDAVAVDTVRVAQQVPEFFERCLRQFGIAPHHSENRVQRIEEEVRIQLRS